MGVLAKTARFDHHAFMRVGASLLFNLAAAVAGTVLVALIGAEHGSHQVRDLAATLAVFVLVVFVLNYQESLTLAIRRPGRWRVSKSVRSTWGYEGARGPIVIHDRLRIRQVGRLVIASGESQSIEGDPGFRSFQYRVRASLNPEGVLEGRWENRQDRNYYGSFQLLGQRDGTGFRGKWIGMSRSGSVKSGTWVWHGRDSPQAGPDAGGTAVAGGAQSP